MTTDAQTKAADRSSPACSPDNQIVAFDPLLSERLAAYAEADDLLPQERADLYEAARLLALCKLAQGSSTVAREHCRSESGLLLPHATDADQKYPGGCALLLPSDQINGRPVGGIGKWLVKDQWLAAYGIAREMAGRRVPEDWVLVPRVLPIEMDIAFCEAWFSRSRAIDDSEMQDAWDAALAAIPSAPLTHQSTDDCLTAKSHAAPDSGQYSRVFGTIAGILPHQRAVEVKLDSGVPDWMTGAGVRVAISLNHAVPIG